MNRPKRKIAFADVNPESVRITLKLVEHRYDFELTRDRTADYVFHSVGGMDVLNYSGVRIFTTGENVSPNFSISDYAIGFDHLSYGDRYIWMPIKLCPSYETMLTPRPPARNTLADKAGFCAYVMSNTKNSAPERTRIFDLLNDYKTVNSGGTWNNNTGGPVADKLAFQSMHKFVIAFENCSHPGYLTEKLFDAAASNAVPIYWGDPTIGKLFNPKAFVNCHDFQTLEEAVERVKEIDQNDDLYLQILAEPWFPDGVEPKCLRNETFQNFLCNIFDQDPKKAFRRNRGRWGLKYEKNMRDMYFRPHVQAWKLMRAKWHRLRHRSYYGM